MSSYGATATETGVVDLRKHTEDGAVHGVKPPRRSSAMPRRDILGLSARFQVLIFERLFGA